MAPVTYTIINIQGREWKVPADTDDSILQLAERVERATGISKETFVLLPRGRQTPLTHHNSTTLIKNLGSMTNTDTLYLIRRPREPRAWRYNYNRTSITDPNQRRHHARVVGERLQRRINERRALAEVAEAKNLAPNVEFLIGRYLGGNRKTRKTNHYRKHRQTRRR